MFEEDHFSIVMSPVNGECDWDGDDSVFKEPKKVDGLCIMEYSEDYELTDEGDYFKICLEGTCLKVYPKDRGIIMSDPNTGCMILVSDISNPSMIEEESEYETYTTLSQEWYDEFETISKEIEDDGMPSSCDESNLAENSTGGGLDNYQFDDRDAANDPAMSANGSDALVHIMMTQGSSLSWALVDVSIVVDGGASLQCTDEGWADEYSSCVYTTDEDKNWDVAGEITIYEGSDTDLCDGSNGYCVIDVTISKKAVGNDDGGVLVILSAIASA